MNAHLMIKRSVAVAAIVALVLSAACGKTIEDPVPIEIKEPPMGSLPPATDNVEVDEHPNLVDLGDDVAITFPAEMFEGVELSDAFIKTNDYIDAVRNEDGRVTITMSKTRQQEFMNAFRSDVDYNIEYFISEVDYVKYITFRDDFTSMELYVDGDTDRSILPELPYFFSYPFEQYQLMEGREVHFTITVYDAETKVAIMQLVFPLE